MWSSLSKTQTNPLSPMMASWIAEEMISCLISKSSTPVSFPCVSVHHCLHHRKHIVNAVGRIRHNISACHITDDLHLVRIFLCPLIPSLLKERIPGNPGHSGACVQIMLCGKKIPRSHCESGPLPENCWSVPPGILSICRPHRTRSHLSPWAPWSESAYWLSSQYC